MENLSVNHKLTIHHDTLLGNGDGTLSCGMDNIIAKVGDLYLGYHADGEAYIRKVTEVDVFDDGRAYLRVRKYSAGGCYKKECDELGWDWNLSEKVCWVVLVPEVDPQEGIIGYSLHTHGFYYDKVKGPSLYKWESHGNWGSPKEALDLLWHSSIPKLNLWENCKKVTLESLKSEGMINTEGSK